MGEEIEEMKAALDARADVGSEAYWHAVCELYEAELSEAWELLRHYLDADLLRTQSLREIDDRARAVLQRTMTP